MPYIYVPRGKAREYSPLALNIYTECDHGCTYCYAPTIMRACGRAITHQPRMRIDMPRLAREAARIDKDTPILLCFTCDPYCHHDVIDGGTRRVLEILAKNECTVSLLSKGGRRMLRDEDILGTFGRRKIAIGTTLVFGSDAPQKTYEPFAAPTQERIDMLRHYHDAGYRTWVSFEPVFDARDTLALIDATVDIADVMKVGKLNHDPVREATVNWSAFGHEAERRLLDAGKEYYLKKDLRREMERDSDGERTREATCGDAPKTQAPPRSHGGLSPD